MEKRKAVIISAARTPVGRMGGNLKKFEGYQLGAIAVREAVKRSGVDPSEIVEVYMGNAEGLRAIWEDVLRWKQGCRNLSREYNLTVSVHPDLKL